MMIDNTTIKGNARAQLGGSIFSNHWLMMLVCSLIVSAINGIAANTIVATLIVFGPLSYGFARVAVARACGYPTVEIGDTFKGFTENFGNSVLLGIMNFVFVFLWSLLLIIPGVVKRYSYSMCFFIQQDDPSKDWKTCLKESSEMMEGFKWELFCIDVTMFFWALLGLLACGIGILFVMPYQQMSHANFYLARKAIRDGVAPAV